MAIRNAGLWNPEYSSRNPESHEQFGIQNPSSTEIEYLESGIHSVEFTIQDSLGFPHMGRNFTSQAASINP